jgi:hypothetical protein
VNKKYLEKIVAEVLEQYRKERAKRRRETLQPR